MNCISRPHKLYVIGNGFDLHHGLPCSYSDFEVWLQENRPNVYRNMNRIYGECHESGSVIFECKEGPFVEHEVEGILELPKK